ncbi:MAG: sialate O-acetylesterase, partial [Planctomycetota bacterium]|nr:sialate O-acetylesterase [Planctomycetota bacterium]
MLIPAASRFIVLIVCSLLAHPLVAMQKLEVAVPFTDNLILQRHLKVPVWGFDDPGNRITVQFAGQTQTAIVDRFGNWTVDLKPLEASHRERVLSITNDQGERILINGVLVGEVWFASGQSNMVWTAGKSLCSEIARKIAGDKNGVPIREINIDTVSALYPQKRATSEKGWKLHTHAPEFSALSLAFAYRLHQELNVPVGILLSAHSNTRIEAFTQRQAIENHPQLTTDRQLIVEADPLTPQGQRAYARYPQELRSWQAEAGKALQVGGRVPPRPNLPGIAGMWRGPSQFFNGKINPVIPFAIRGALWCQGTSNSGDGRVYAARMEALIQGWRKAWKRPNLPFYFTQMQCYGTPDPNTVGFADLRQVQHLFFIKNRHQVGMVVQSDLNSARPQGIHYANKLHPGMRLARWALAKQYNRPIAYTGPIYSGYQIKGESVIVSFEPESLFGGLMVGSKGLAQNLKEPGGYVEPAKPTPDEPLNHFRLCGADRIWHPAKARITGDTVVVTSANVSQPLGVQYAYSAVPENSNLYNRAGLPATPFAVINNQFIFEEDDLEKAAALKAKYARYTDPDYPILQVVEYFRDGAVIQRNQPIPVWGHANEGVQVTVTMGELTRTAIANGQQQWSVTFPPFQASQTPVSLSVKSSHGHERLIKNILVGDVWYLTGSTMLNGEMAYYPNRDQTKPPANLPLVREFRRKTKASTFPTPRKRKFETGGGRYRSSWMGTDSWEDGQGLSMFAYHFAKTLNRKGIPQGFITMSSGQGGRNGQMASPLSWTSFDGVRNVEHPQFKRRLQALFLQYPQTKIARQTATEHLNQVEDFTRNIIAAKQQDLSLANAAPLAAPSLSQAGSLNDIQTDMIPTYSYNWCVSPMTPMAIAGVVWVPSENNIGHTSEHYGTELEI